MVRGKTPHTPSAKVVMPTMWFGLIVGVLVLFGLVMVFSASFATSVSEGNDATEYLVKQLVFLVIGAAAAVVIWKLMPYEWLFNNVVLIVLYALTFVALIATCIFGEELNGATRWIYIGGMSIQPSEFAKIVFILVSAKCAYEYRMGNIDPKKSIILIAVLVFAPILVFIAWLQSDLGSTLVCCFGVLIVLFIAEYPLKFIGALVAGAVVTGILFILVSPYRLERIQVWLDPWSDGEDGYGTGYNSIRSYYAFAEGGLFGVGLGNSHEKYLYLFAPFSDFIFSIIGEEMGIVGASVVVLLYILLAVFGFRLAKNINDDYGAIIIGSLVSMLVFQAFLNMASACGLLPVTGKPLPFISAGGSSLISSLMLVGIVLCIANRAFQPDEYEARRDNLSIISSRNARSSQAGYQAGYQAGGRSHVISFEGVRGGAVSGARSGESVSRSSGTSRSSGASRTGGTSRTSGTSRTNGGSTRTGSSRNNSRR